jgi:hypothetical protein
MSQLTRRDFLAGTARMGVVAAATLGVPVATLAREPAAEKKGGEIRYGLVTYQWARDWDLPTLLKNCESAGVLGVELRTTHKHGVEPNLNDAQRAEVRKKFEATPVQLVGLGSDERFDNPDQAVLQKSIEATKGFIRLSHDVGGTGVKVKPDSFHEGVPREKTIEQIGKTLNLLGEYATGFGQQVRLEVHGKCCQLPTIKAILDVADNPNVYICWNSNLQDLEAPGLESNFNLVKHRLGPTTHVRCFDTTHYPWAQLLDLYVKADYSGWMMLEEGKVPADAAAELVTQRKLFDKMLAEARERSG